jgi:serine/threonine protein kinase
LVDTFRAQVDGGPTRVVLKVLFLDRADERITRPAAERFLRAGRRCQEVSQPGIGRVIDVSDDPTAAFVATELVPGTDLAQLLARSPQVSDVRNKKRAVAPNVAAMVCAQIAQTVDRAHSHSPALSHLGLAPGNIIVTADGGVTVLDFGLMASVRKDGLCPVQKWHFVAPELVGKEAWEVPPGAALAADLYALGALLYFMLTGSPPTSPEAARSPTELVRQSRPLSFPAGLPDGLVHAMRILTAVDPADRPTSAKTAVEMLRAESQNCRLDHALRALGVSPPPTAEDGVSPKTRPVTTPGPRPLPRSSVESGANNRRDARRGRLDGAPRPGRGWAGKTVASAALLAALGMYFGLRSRRPRPSPSVAPTEVPAKPRANEPPITPAVPALPRANPEIPGPGHGYVPDPERVPVRLPGHLFIDTSPSQAAVWIDGSLRGKTPVDLEVGPGVHRMIAVKPGYRMWLAVYDTTQGEFARREFQAASPPIAGDAFLDVRCPVPDRYPIILDDEETGLLCPVERLPVVSGKHTVGIFVPARRANVTSSVVALRGRQPLRVDLKD